MSNSRLVSGRVKKNSPSDVSTDRYNYISLADAEPDFGVPSADNQVVVSDTNGNRSFVTPDLNFVASQGSTTDISLEANLLGNTIGVHTGDVTGDVTGTVSSLSNHTTSDLAEGDDLYFTIQRARDSFSAGTGITIVDGVIDVGQQVGPTDNVAFNDVTINGVLTSNDITSENIEATGNLVVTGDLTVLGNTTVQETDDLVVTNLTITVASGAINRDTANGAGLVVDGADATIKYASIPNAWRFNKNVEAPRVFASLTGNVTGNLTGDVTGDVAGDLTGHLKANNGSTILENGATQNDALFYGNIVGSDSTVIVSNTGALQGTLTGDVVGDVTGDLTGDVTGNVTGNLTGDVDGQVSDISNHTSDNLPEGTINKYFSTANIDSTILGGTGVTVSAGTISIGQDVGTDQNVSFNRVIAPVTGDLTGDVTGNLTGNVTGNVTGNLTGDAAGNHTGTFTGDVIGDVTGDVTGGLTGDVTGNIIGNVLAADGETAVLENGSDGTDAVFNGNVNIDSGTSVFNNINVNGVILGQTAGTTDGNLRGDVLAQDGTKILENGSNGTDATFTGSLLGNVTIGSGTSSFNAVTANSVTANGVTIGSVTGQMAGNVIGDILAADGTKILENGTDGSDAVLTGTVSSIANHDTDDLAEGSSNLYFTNTRADARISAASVGDLSDVDITTVAPTNGQTIIWNQSAGEFQPGESFSAAEFDSSFALKDTNDLAEGTGVNSNLYFTTARARGVISATSSGAGSLTYNNNTGVIAYVGPDELTAGTGVDITDGVVSIGQAVAVTSDVTFNDVTVSGDLIVSGTTTTVNTETVSIADNIIVLNSNASGAPSQNAGIEIERGDSVNVQFVWDETADRWSTGSNAIAASSFVGDLSGQALTVASFTGLDTDDLTEGASNLYYTDARVTAHVDKAFVDNLAVDADQLDGQEGVYYLNYNNLNNTPENLSDFNDDLNLEAEPIITFTLGVDGTSNFLFTGPGFPSAASDPDLILVRGLKYIFDNSDNYVAHPFVIRETFDGTNYTDGVSTSNGVTTFTVPMDAPSNLVYQCVNHGANMRGNILVLSQGVAALDNLLDVEVTNPANGQALVYNSGTGQWTNAATSAPPFTEVTGNTTMEVGGQYFANTSGGAFTLTLPGSPSIGDQITIIDAAGTAGTNNITIGRNGNRIQGQSQDLLIDSNRAAFTLVYYNFINGWLFRDN